MAKSKPITVECRYFVWRLRLRNNVWQADSRGNNKLKGRRHSLGTRDLEEAKQLVHMLDEQVAQDQGLTQYRRNSEPGEFRLAIDEGFSIYQSHIKRPRAAKGPKLETQKRYGRIIRAFREFLRSKHVQFWEQVNKQLMDEYAAFRSLSWKTSSVALELNQICTILNFFRNEKLLDQNSSFRYPVDRQNKSTRYCPLPEEMSAILEILHNSPKLVWLYRVVLMLAYTGLRLGEIAQITSHDIDLTRGVIYVLDEEEIEDSEKATKTGDSRFVPIHRVLEPMLKELVTFEDNRLFNGPRGGKLRSETFGNNLRSKALVPLSQRFPHAKFKTITAHCLRHFFNSLCSDSGISARTTESWMGHKTDSMSRRYYHGNIKSARENIEKIKPISELDNDVQAVDVEETIVETSSTEIEDEASDLRHGVDTQDDRDTNKGVDNVK